MEVSIGRKLKTLEHVHHKDGDIFNNDLSNLEVLSASDHARLHFTKTNKTYSKCELCDEVCDGSRRFCGVKCFDLWRSSLIPDKETIVSDLLSSETFTSLGKKHGVSCNAFRKWCVKYGLPSRLKERKHWVLSH